MANPTLWGSAVQEIFSLNPRQYLEQGVLEFVLRDRWLCIGRTSPVLFVDYGTVYAIGTTYKQIIKIDDEFVKRYRQGIMLPIDGVIPKRPVAMPFWRGSHYFTVVFDYTDATACILGHHIICNETVVHKRWEKEWDGSSLWIKIAQLFDWEPPTPDSVTVTNINWPQVSFLKW